MKVQIVLITDRRDIWYGTNNPVLIEFDFDIFKNYNNYLESKFYKAYHLSFKDYLLWNNYLKHIDVDAELFCDNKAIKNCYSTGLVNGGSGFCLIGEDSNREYKRINKY